MEENEDERVVKLNDIEKDELFSYKKKNYLKNIIIIILVIIVIGLGVFIFILLKGKKDNDDKGKEKECKPGYFIPDDDLTKKKCEPCSESNCATCKGTKSNNTCLNCFDDYYLVNNKCKPYSFKVIYNNDKIYETFQLINHAFLPYLIGMYMNNLKCL